jgi:hypothetical protein
MSDTGIVEASVQEPVGFEDIWAVCEEWLHKALILSECADSIEMVKGAVMNGSCQLFFHPQGAVVTLVDRFEKKRSLRVWLAGGAMEAMEAILPNVEQFAREAGCEQLLFQGRSGWQRTFLASAGFHLRAVEMAKALGPVIVEASDGIANNH